MSLDSLNDPKPQREATSQSVNRRKRKLKQPSRNSHAAETPNYCHLFKQKRGTVILKPKSRTSAPHHELTVNTSETHASLLGPF